MLLLPALLTAAVVTSGCGNLSLGDKVQLNLDAERQVAQLSVEMSDGLQINLLNGAFPIAGGKGQLIFTPATRTTNARIGVEVNLAALAAGQMADVGSISTLPNGSPLPVAINAPLLTVPVIQNRNFDVNAVFSITPELQIGAAVGITQMSNQYIPDGIAVCQNFRNEQNFAFAAVCLYGPSTGKSGGVFVAANLGDVFNSFELEPEMLASTSSRALMVAAPQASVMKAFNPISMSSKNWSSEMYDPRNKLSGSSGQKALRNAQRILKAN